MTSKLHKWAGSSLAGGCLFVRCCWGKAVAALLRPDSTRWLQWVTGCGQPMGPDIVTVIVAVT